MSVFRLPNIGDGPEKEQLRQLKSYLYQLVEQLNLELETPKTETRQNVGAVSDRPPASR